MSDTKSKSSKKPASGQAIPDQAAPDTKAAGHAGGAAQGEPVADQAMLRELTLAEAEAEERAAMEAAEARRQEKEAKAQGNGGGFRYDFDKMCRAVGRGELGDVELLKECLGDTICYDHARQAWFEFSGHRWHEDGVKRVNALVRDLANHYEKAAIAQWTAYQEAERGTKTVSKDLWDALDSRARSLRGKTRIKNVLESATFGREHFAIAGDEWERNPTILACANGVIDLETGRLHKGEPGQFQRRASPWEYHGLHVEDEFWTDSLPKLFCGDAEVEDYMERVIGYAATGLVTHKEIYCGYGPGGDNGKSLGFFGPIQDALGGYAGTVAVKVLLSDKFNKTDESQVVKLDGLRMAVFSEAPRGSRFAMDLIKAMTGGDVVTARGLYKDPIDFLPICKPFLHSNFMPQAVGNDPAFIKRLRVIPFNAKFVLDGDVDEAQHVYRALNKEQLRARLAKAGPAILAWIVRGARRFLRDGDLRPPQAVLLGTEEYRDDQDVIGQFLEACCEFRADASVQAGDIYMAFRAWSLEQGTSPKMIMSQRNFGEDLKTRTVRERGRVVMYRGIKVRDEWEKKAQELRDKEAPKEKRNDQANF